MKSHFHCVFRKEVYHTIEVPLLSIFTLSPICPHPSKTSPILSVLKCTCLVYPSLSFISKIYSAVDKICTGVKHFHFMTNIAMLQQKNSNTGDHEIYSYRRPFTAHNYYILLLSHLCLGVEKKICKQCISPRDYYGTSLHKNLRPGFS